MVNDRTALMSAKALSPGYEILWYTIDRVLGQGGFGITYLAHDRNLDRAVAIKEYLPTTFAYRHENYSVKPITGDHRENFTWGLGSFLKEAQTLARFSHPNIVRVHSVFEENNTAYMVMEYEHGQNLAHTYKHGKNLDQAFFEQIFFPIMDGLKEIHKFEFIHRDIKPANIYIRGDGTPVLIDFGSARQTTQQQTSEMTTLVSQGYTPLEQYSANYGDQGPWTDVYAMAATLYEGIVGRKPDESLSRSACLMRSKPDLLECLGTRDYPAFSQRFLNAVHAGLKLEPEGRPQTLEAWAQLFAQGSEQFVSSNDSRGFTELDDERTRIQPRRTVSERIDDPLDLFADPDAEPSYSQQAESDRRQGPLATESMRDHRPADQRTVGPESRQGAERAPAPVDDFFDVSEEPPASPSVSQRIAARAQTDRLLDDEFADLNDDAPPFAPARQRASRSQRSVPTPPVQARKGSRLWVAMLAVLLLAGAGGGYYYYSTSQPLSELSAATLQSLPRPAQSIATVLPKESVLEQLSYMQELASVLNQAWQIKPEDPMLLETIRSTEAGLLTLSRQWNASQYAAVASSIRSVSQALPAATHDQSRVESILSASAQVSAYTELMALLEDERYLTPAGSSVLDRITTVNASDYQKLSSSDEWQQMMVSFSARALEKLAQSRYDEAARLTEAALTLDSDNAGFLALRSFLNGT